MLDALLADEVGVRFILVGTGIDVDRLSARVKAEGLADVAFLPRRPISEIGTVLAAADALLVHLRNDPLLITIPSKTQAYLHAGRPVLMGARRCSEHHRPLGSRARLGATRRLWPTPYAACVPCRPTSARSGASPGARHYDEACRCVWAQTTSAC